MTVLKSQVPWVNPGRTLETTQSDGGVVGDDLGPGHDERLGDHGVDLAGHNGGPGLHRGQLQLAQSQSRPRPEETDVVGDLDQRGRQGFKRTADLHAGVARGLGLEVVHRLDELHAGQRREPLRHQLTEIGMSIDTGSHFFYVQNHRGKYGQ